jgi:hypothetical protein
MKGRKAISGQTKIILLNTSVIGLSTCRSYSIKLKCIHQIEDVDKGYRFERGRIGRRASPSQPGEGAVGTEPLRTAADWRGPSTSGGPDLGKVEEAARDP